MSISCFILFLLTHCDLPLSALDWDSIGFGFSRQGFSVSWIHTVEQAGLKLIEISCLCLPEHWDYRIVPLRPALALIFKIK